MAHASGEGKAVQQGAVQQHVVAERNTDRKENKK
jgi:hypothetical protein